MLAMLMRGCVYLSVHSFHKYVCVLMCCSSKMLLHSLLYAMCMCFDMLVFACVCLVGHAYVDDLGVMCMLVCLYAVNNLELRRDLHSFSACALFIRPP